MSIGEMQDQPIMFVDNVSLFADQNISAHAQMDEQGIVFIQLGKDSAIGNILAGFCIIGGIDTDSYTNSLLYRVESQSSYISEIYVNTEIAQTISWGEYYGSVGTRFDFSNDDDYDNGDIGVDLGVGVRFNAADNLSGEIGVTKLFLQTDEEDVTVSANVRYQF